MRRLLLILVGAMAGCGDDGDDAAVAGPAPVVIPTRESFTDHFSAGFPNDDWVVEQAQPRLTPPKATRFPRCP